MVMQSVIQSGAVSIPKDSSSVSSASTSVDVSSSLFQSNSQLSYRLLNATEITGSAFFKIGLDMTRHSMVFFYQVKPVEGTAASRIPVTDRAFVIPSKQVAYLEAVRPVSHSNKETLTSLLELAEESTCECVYACVNKENALFRDVVRSYLAVGFSMVTPSNGDPANFVLLSFDI